ncbi:MAG TPA: hypothetical protein DF294_05960 [Psychrobacter sp.]|nr:hypothetical protein [Psychrobacter sp.]
MGGDFLWFAVQSAPLLLLSPAPLLAGHLLANEKQMLVRFLQKIYYLSQSRLTLTPSSFAKIWTQHNLAAT